MVETGNRETLGSEGRGPAYEDDKGGWLGFFLILCWGGGGCCCFGVFCGGGGEWGEFTSSPSLEPSPPPLLALHSFSLTPTLLVSSSGGELHETFGKGV